MAWVLLGGLVIVATWRTIVAKGIELVIRRALPASPDLARAAAAAGAAFAAEVNVQAAIQILPLLASRGPDKGAE